MAYSYEKVDKKLLVPQTEDQLMLFLLQDEFEIGSKLPNEYVLAQKFGVGRSTIREAIKSLASKGILEVRRGSGTYLKSKAVNVSDPLSLSKIKDKYQMAMDLFDVRILLEPEIAVLACRYATEEEKQKIKTLCDEVETLYLSGQNHIQKDMEFHAAIAACSRNHVIDSLIPIIFTAVTTFGNLTQRKLINETIDTHREITNAILRGDSVGAKCAMIMHLTYNRQLLVSIMEENAERHQITL